MKSHLHKLIVAAVLMFGATGVNAQIINTYAGNGTSGYTGDGGAATLAELNNPGNTAVDALGNVYISDNANNRIRKVTTSGIITTIIGTGTAGFSGDGGPASAAQISSPAGIAVDGYYNIYFADNGNGRVRKISTAGIVTTIAGNGITGYSGDGGPATNAEINNPRGIAVDGYGFVYIADKNNSRLRVINSSGIITTKTGNGIAGFSGDGGPASAAEINNPMDVSVDASGNVYVADYGNNRIRKINPGSIISTIAGTGTAGYSGDGGPATAGEINLPTGVAADIYGNVYIADNSNNRIRKVTTAGNIKTAAGTGTLGYSGDGGPAVSAMISAYGVASDASGYYIYISGESQARVRRFDSALYVAPITGSSSVCVGGTITLSDATPGGVWSSSAPSIATVGATTGIVTGVTPGTVTITYMVGTSIVTTTITVTTGLTVTASAAYAACGGVYTLTASGGTTYSWSPSTGLSCATCSSTTIDPTATTTFTVTGTTGGCSGSAAVTIDGNRITGTISPTVTGSVRVWLVQFNPIDSSILATDSAMACTSGGTMYYQFMDPAAGDYLVKAYELGGTPGTSGYIPTYGLSAPHWDSATTVTHAAATNNQNITMIYGTVPAGPGFISGYVVSGAGKNTSGDVPAVGMLVYLEDASGHIITYTYTNTAGLYSFGSLANGSYIIYPEAYKYYTTHSSVITLSPSYETAANIDFKQHTSFGTITPVASNNVLQASGGADMKLYPNPTSGNLNFEWNNQSAGNANVTVTDMLGRQVLSAVLDINGVKGQAVIDMSAIEHGVYIISIRSGSNNYCGRVVIE